jgi:hypothetical protein
MNKKKLIKETDDKTKLASQCVQKKQQHQKDEQKEISKDQDQQQQQ